MSRFASLQPDLFAPAARVPAPSCSPLSELVLLLKGLQAAERAPWADAAGAMAEERRALGLASLAGAEGQRLAEAILQETERLLAAADAESG